MCCDRPNNKPAVIHQTCISHKRFDCSFEHNYYSSHCFDFQSKSNACSYAFFVWLRFALDRTTRTHTLRHQPSPINHHHRKYLSSASQNAFDPHTLGPKMHGTHKCAQANMHANVHARR